MSGRAKLSKIEFVAPKEEEDVTLQKCKNDLWHSLYGLRSNIQWCTSLTLLKISFLHFKYPNKTGAPNWYFMVTDTVQIAGRYADMSFTHAYCVFLCIEIVCSELVNPDNDDTVFVSELGGD